LSSSKACSLSFCRHFLFMGCDGTMSLRLWNLAIDESYSRRNRLPLR
jgi:hypothetical protein